MIIDQVDGWLNNKASVDSWWHVVCLEISTISTDDTCQNIQAWLTLKTKFVTTPTLLPAPRTAQKRSVFSFSLAIKISPEILMIFGKSIFRKVSDLFR